MESTPQLKVDSTEKGLVLTISHDLIGREEIQRFIDYIRYKVLVSQSQATDEDVEQLSEDIEAGLALRNQGKRSK